MIYRFDSPTCLNGWWDFCPIYKETYPHNQIPTDGWEEGKYLVPSYYNVPGDGIMYGGDEFFHPSGLSPKKFISDRCENLFDTFHYPRKWSLAHAAWVKRKLTVHKTPGKRYFLVCEALGPKAWIYLNGRNVKFCRENMLPQEVDLTDYLDEGENTLAILLEDYERSDTGRHLWPSGNFITAGLFGIWQDVYLIEKNEVYLDDVTIVTSVREKTLTLRYTVKNLGKTARTVTIHPTVSGWRDGSAGVSVPVLTVTVPRFDEARAEVTVRWESPELWDAFHPYLYRLVSTLSENGESVDTMTERFGFREVWIDGKHVMLNGHPVHLFADWGHTVTCFSCVKEWIEKWFSMMKDTGLNASRLHTHPHPKLVMDLADEWGIYIIGETGAHGSGGMQASSTAEYWDHLRRHISGFIKRDKNSPSVLMWSCANEMRWGCDADDRMLRIELDRVRHQFNREDPTRPAYHEGDTSLWNEKELEVISRHYGKECSGIGWWDGTQPLHCGEVGNFHYAGPNNAVQFAGDRGYSNYRDVSTASANDVAWIDEDGRANGVLCLGQWNVSCLMNLRRNEEHEFTYDDYTVPGMKPLYAHEGASEFEFWKPGKGYWTQPGWELIRHAFRPFAALCLSRRTGYLAGAEHRISLTLANDTAADAAGKITVGFRKDGAVLASATADFSVARGYTSDVTLTVPASDAGGECELFVTALSSDDRVLDDWSKTVWLEAPVLTPVSSASAVCVIGAGYFRELFRSAGIHADYRNETDDLSAYRLLVVEKNAVTEGSRLNTVVREFASRGGRVIVFEQRVSLFPGLVLEPKQMQTAFFRADGHPVFRGIDEKELRFWSDDPYSLLSGDGYVTTFMYRKDDGSYMKPLLDAGEGGFGTGDLESTPLFEAREGKGLIVSCQMNVSDRFRTIPAAMKLIRNLLTYADGWSAEKYTAPVKCVFADSTTDAKLRAALDAAKDGANVLVFRASRHTLDVITEVTGVRFRTHTERLGTWNCVKHENDATNAGVSDADLCGYERFTYCKAGTADQTISEFVIRPAKALHPLLETSPESCIYSMWPGYGRTEILRAYTATRFCYGEKLPHELLAGWFAYGKGRVYFSVFHPVSVERDRFRRFENQLRRSLGDDPMKGKQSPLHGDAVVDTNPSGKGYPEIAYFFSGRLTDAELKEKLELCAYQTERMEYSPILFDGSFHEAQAPDGVFAAVPADGAPVYMYSRLNSPSVRKNFGSDQAIPDPGAQTFLDVYADGATDLYINGRHIGHAVSENGRATYPDIELESGLNHILLVFRPATGDPTVKTAWRNIVRHPETGFRFDRMPQW